MKSFARTTLATGLLVATQTLPGVVTAQPADMVEMPIPGPYQVAPAPLAEGRAFAPPPGSMGIPYWMQQDRAVAQQSATAAVGGGASAGARAGTGGGASVATRQVPSYAPLEAAPQSRQPAFGQTVAPGYYPGVAQWGAQPWPPQYAAPQAPDEQRTTARNSVPGYYAPYGPQPYPAPQGWGWAPAPAWPGAWPQQPARGAGQ